MIEFRNISHSYSDHEEHLVLQDISFTIASGECVGLTGPSGCGKSTLAHIAAGHITPTAGQVLVDGVDLTSRPSRQVFMIQQEPALFPWQTVQRQVTFAMRPADPLRVVELLAMVRLTGFEEYYPRQLSGGMKKRLALARALAVNPKLLVLDESFSSLDYSLKAEIYADLHHIRRETAATILLITHDSTDLENLAHREICLSADKPTTIKEIRQLR